MTKRSMDELHRLIQRLKGWMYQGWTVPGCECHVHTGPDGSWIYCCPPCEALGHDQLTSSVQEREELLGADLFQQGAPVRPLDVVGIPANGTEAYFAS